MYRIKSKVNVLNEKRNMKLIFTDITFKLSVVVLMSVMEMSAQVLSYVAYKPHFQVLEVCFNNLFIK